MFFNIYEMLIIVIFEFFIVLIAKGWDFCSGYYKAKQIIYDRSGGYSITTTSIFNFHS